MNNDIKRFIKKTWDSADLERFPGPQPVSIEKKHLPLLSKNEYLVCEKTDGIRNFLVCFTDSENRKICALVNRSFDYMLFPLTVPRDTLLDGEYIDGKFIVHDAVCIAGEDLRLKKLTERLDHARSLVKAILPTPKLRVQCKNMIPYSEIKKLVLGEHTDGVIFTPVNEPIRMGTHRTLFKWKPLDRITIDFLVRNGKFCIQHEGKYLSVQDCDEEDDGSIYECSFDGENSVWKSIKKRTDKSHPNNKRTFERTLVNIRENIKFCDLVLGSSGTGLKIQNGEAS